MEAARPSRTALRVAFRRAAHQLYDRPLVFEDPLALKILGAEYVRDVEKTPWRRDRPASAGLRAFIVARSRWAEDTIALGVGQGLGQYVLLGAGLDTFAYRNPFPQLRVFEVDHPATQAWKHELLARGGIAAAESLRYVPVDFERDSLAEQLAAAGFARGKPALFAWLGVVPYLTHQAFRSTLSLVSRSAAGSGLVMDYAQPRSVLPPHEQLERDSLAMRVQLAGEPFRLFLTPEQMRHELASFRSVEDLGATEINALFFKDREDGLRVRGAAAQLLRAWV